LGDLGIGGLEDWRIGGLEDWRIGGYAGRAMVALAMTISQISLHRRDMFIAQTGEKEHLPLPSIMLF
jgi:hypothetical protein